MLRGEREVKNVQLPDDDPAAAVGILKLLHGYEKMSGAHTLKKVYLVEKWLLRPTLVADAWETCRFTPEIYSVLIHDLSFAASHTEILGKKFSHFVGYGRAEYMARLKGCAGVIAWRATHKVLAMTTATERVGVPSYRALLKEQAHIAFFKHVTSPHLSGPQG